MLSISRDKNAPDEEFRKAYLQRCELLRQYRRMYGQEAYEQLRDELDEAHKAYMKQYEAEEQLESQKDQIKELRQQLSEMDAVANAHTYEIMDVKRRILDDETHKSGREIKAGNCPVQVTAACGEGICNYTVRVPCAELEALVKEASREP